jgi:hypothetical protein
LILKEIYNGRKPMKDLDMIGLRMLRRHKMEGILLEVE